MKPGAPTLAQRRLALLGKSALQRAALAEQLAALHPAAAMLDKGLAVLERLRQKPLLFIGAAAALLLFRRARGLVRPPRLLKVFRLLKPGLLLWKALGVFRALRHARAAPEAGGAE